jgi:hypothetical protein
MSNAPASLLSLVLRGAFGLPVHAWLIGILGGFIFSQTLLFAARLTGIKLLLIPAACLAAAYYVVAGIGLWRAAKRYTGLKLWAYLHQALALFIAVGFPVGFAASFLR